MWTRCHAFQDTGMEQDTRPSLSPVKPKYRRENKISKAINSKRDISINRNTPHLAFSVFCKFIYKD